MGDALAEQLLDDALHRGQIGIQADGGKQGFERVGQNGRSVVAAAFQFAHAQRQCRAYAQFSRQFRQCGFFHQMGAQDGQTAFGQVGEGVVQHLRHHEIDNAVADKFQPFVVVFACAAVGERLLQQFGLAESITQTLLQLLPRGVFLRFVHSVSDRVQAAFCGAACTFCWYSIGF